MASKPKKQTPKTAGDGSTPATPATPKVKVWSPEILEAREKCKAMREECELECKALTKAARQAAAVRRLTLGMTPEQKEALRQSLEDSEQGEAEPSMTAEA